MVQVTEQTRRSIDRILDRALAAWRELPDVAEEIERWDEIERLDFVHEWPLQEMKLAQLRAHAADGALDASQAERFRELESVVAENRPTIEDLQRRYIG